MEVIFTRSTHPGCWHCHVTQAIHVEAGLDRNSTANTNIDTTSVSIITDVNYADVDPSLLVTIIDRSSRSNSFRRCGVFRGRDTDGQPSVSLYPVGDHRNI